VRIATKDSAMIVARIGRRLAALVLAGALAGCIYDAPITPAGTRDVDPRLVGQWTTTDGGDRVDIAQTGPRTYRIVYNGDPFRAWHSDLGGVPYVTAQQESGTEHKYSYVAWVLSADGRRLRALAVTTAAVPTRRATSPAAARAALAAHRDDPALFGDEPLDLIRVR
jgi:hypothetical protein